MKVLFKKDLTVSIKYIFLLLVGFSFFLGMLAYMVEGDLLAQSLYVSIVLMSTIGVFNALMTEDEKYNTDILFNSLPLERKTIVISKYLSMALLPFIYGVSTFIITRLFNISDSMMFIFTPKNQFAFEMVIFSIGASFILLSLYIPIYYSSIGKAKKIGEAVMLLVFIAPLVLMKFTDNLGDLSIITRCMKSLGLNLALLAISIILYIISLKISIEVYNKKEF